MKATSRAQWLVRQAARKIWFRAAIIAVASVVVAALAGQVATLIPYEFTGNVGQSSVGLVLQIIASSMLAVTTFSLTAMVGAYSSATQLGTARATQLMISDRTSQNALSTFLGAFVFAVVGIIGLQTELYGGQGRVVLLLATVLVIALVVVTLLRWIAHLAAFGRMADVIDRVEDAARGAMCDYRDDPLGGGRPAVPIPDGATPLFARRIGYVTHVDVVALGRMARKGDLVVHVIAVPGTLVHDDRPLMRVEGNADEEAREDLVKAFTVERHRSFDNDPRLGAIALAEIASRALSPAVNDPGTAIEVLNALLRTLGDLPADTGGHDDDAPPVHMPHHASGDLLRDGFLPIIRDGAAHEEVAIRGVKILRALAAGAPHLRLESEALVNAWRRAAERTVADDEAKARVVAICRQG